MKVTSREFDMSLHEMAVAVLAISSSKGKDDPPSYISIDDWAGEDSGSGGAKQ